MKRAPISYRSKRAAKHQLEVLRQVERDFHVRAFGEELAQVNLDMTMEERLRYLQWMRTTARKHGISTERPLPYGISENGDDL